MVRSADSVALAMPKDDVFTPLPTDKLRLTIETALAQLEAPDALTIAPGLENYNERSRQKRLAHSELETRRRATTSARERYRATGGNPIPFALFISATQLSLLLEYLQSRFLASLLFREWGDDVLDIAGWSFAAGLLVVAHHFSKAVRAILGSRGGFPEVAVGRRGWIATALLIGYLILSGGLIYVTGESFGRFIGGAAVLLVAVAVQFAAPTWAYVIWRTEWARRPWLAFRHWFLRWRTNRAFRKMTLQLAEISQPTAGSIQ